MDAETSMLDRLERDIKACEEYLGSTSHPNAKYRPLHKYTIPVEFSLTKRSPRSEDVPTPSSPPAKPRRKSRSASAIDARISQWVVDHKRRQQEREAMKKISEISAVAECTFRPKVRPTKSSVLSSRVPVPERLQTRAHEKAMQLEARRQQAEAQETSGLSFTPEISRRSRLMSAKRRPLSQRLSDMQREEALKKEALRQAHLDELAAEMPFKPELNKKTVSIALRRRMLRQESSGTWAQRRQQAQAAADDLCTFRPVIDETSKHLVERLQASHDMPVDFIERQRLQAERRLSRTMNVAEEGNRRPARRSASVGAQHRKSASSVQDSFNRLSLVDSQKRNETRDMVREEFFSQFEFHPRINERSKQLVSSRSEGGTSARRTHERLMSNERAFYARERIKEEIDTKVNEACSFRPRLSSHSATASGVWQFSESQDVAKRIEAYQESKKAKLDAARRAMEENELKECSFAPTPTPFVAPARGPVVVRGLHRFLQLKQLSERQKREQQEREQEVFHVRNADKLRQGNVTVVKPFAFSGDQSRHRVVRDSIRKEALRAQAAQCTFRPETVSRRRRDMILKILQSDDDDDDQSEEGQPGASYNER